MLFSKVMGLSISIIAEGCIWRKVYIDPFHAAYIWWPFYSNAQLWQIAFFTWGCVVFNLAVVFHPRQLILAVYLRTAVYHSLAVYGRRRWSKECCLIVLLNLPAKGCSLLLRLLFAICLPYQGEISGSF